MQFTALDYRDVNIEDNSVVYCDIPYLGTVGYGNGFNHQEFFDWAATRDFPVYISEYEIDDARFKLFYEIDKRVLLSAEKYKTQTKQERIYWNGQIIQT